MSVLVMAWLVGEGIVSYRSVKHGAPPTPGSLLAVSGFFVLLAALATYKPAAPVAGLLAVGIDVAAFLQVLPGSGPVTQTRTWPPPLINDPTVLLPGQGGATPLAPNLGGSGPGGSMPKGPNKTQPGTPVPPNQGVIFPPGSSVL
jgi:hypothetical protein